MFCNCFDYFVHSACGYLCRYIYRSRHPIASVVEPVVVLFFVFLFVRALGYDFLNASASAKLLNTATNLAALVLFAVKGHVWWHFTLFMALANIAGSLVGSHVALRYGSGFVRVFFMLVVGALIIKTGYDAYLR